MPPVAFCPAHIGLNERDEQPELYHVPMSGTHRPGVAPMNGAAWLVGSNQGDLVVRRETGQE